MRQLYLLCTAFVITFSAKAQSSSLAFKLGNEYSLPRRTTDIGFFGNAVDGIANLSQNDSILHLIFFDPQTLSKKSEETIEIPVTSRQMKSEGVIEFANNKYYWLHSDWERESQRELLYSSRIDIPSGKMMDLDTKVLDVAKISPWVSYHTGMNTIAAQFQFKNTGLTKIDNKYHFEYDVNRTKLLITYRLTPKVKNDKRSFDQIGMHIMDDNMQEIWKGEFTLPYTEAIMDNSDYSIDEAGNAYLLAKVYNNAKHKEANYKTLLPNYHYEILKFTRDSGKMIVIPVSMDDKFLRQANLIENANHEMVIACTYGMHSTTNGTAGIFLATLSNENKLVPFKQGYYEFPKSEVQKFERNGKQRKIDKSETYEIPDLKVKAVTATDDGSILVACEEFTLKTHYSAVPVGFGSYTSYEYLFGDIYASKISSQGNFEWLRKIPKRQSGSNDARTLGFKMISDAGGFHFLYLDDRKNLDLKAEDVPKYYGNGSSGHLVVSTIDSNGNLNKKLVFDTREEDIMILPTKFAQVDDAHFIGRAIIKKTLFQPLLITTQVNGLSTLDK